MLIRKRYFQAAAAAAFLVTIVLLLVYFGFLTTGLLLLFCGFVGGMGVLTSERAKIAKQRRTSSTPLHRQNHRGHEREELPENFNLIVFFVVFYLIAVPMLIAEIFLM